MGRDGESERKGDWLGREWNPRGAFLAPLLFSDSPYFIFLEEEAKGEEEEGTLLVEEAFSYSPEEDLRACLALSPDPLPPLPAKQRLSSSHFSGRIPYFLGDMELPFPLSIFRHGVVRRRGPPLPNPVPHPRRLLSGCLLPATHTRAASSS